MRRDVTRLEDICNALHRVAAYIEGFSEEDFLADDKTRAAVVRELEIIGEAAGHISEAMRVDHPEIPWQRLIRLRNFYIHVYDAVNYSRVWETATRMLPRLEADILPLLPSDEDLA